MILFLRMLSWAWGLIHDRLRHEGNLPPSAFHPICVHFKIFTVHSLTIFLFKIIFRKLVFSDIQYVKLWNHILRNNKTFLFLWKSTHSLLPSIYLNWPDFLKFFPSSSTSLYTSEVSIFLLTWKNFLRADSDLDTSPLLNTFNFFPETLLLSEKLLN